MLRITILADLRPLWLSESIIEPISRRRHLVRSRSYPGKLGDVQAIDNQCIADSSVLLHTRIHFIWCVSCSLDVHCKLATTSSFRLNGPHVGNDYFKNSALFLKVAASQYYSQNSDFATLPTICAFMLRAYVIISEPYLQCVFKLWTFITLISILTKFDFCSKSIGKKQGWSWIA